VFLDAINDKQTIAIWNDCTCTAFQCIGIKKESTLIFTWIPVAYACFIQKTFKNVKNSESKIRPYVAYKKKEKTKIVIL
jgi:hypothetical protein